MDNKKKVGNISLDQKKELIEFMEKHQELRSGKFTNDFTFKKTQLLWIQISNTLNSIPGANKDWRQWRRTWQDMKAVAKKKNSALKNYRAGTGGGPPMPPNADSKLSDEEQKIIDVIGAIVTSGDVSVAESECTFEFSEHNYSILNTHVDNEVIVEMDNDKLDDECVPECTQSDKSCSGSDLQSSVKTNMKINCHVEKSTPTKEKSSVQIENKLKTEPKTKRKPVRVARLQHALSANDKLVEQTERKLKLKEEYLELFKRDVLAKECLAKTFKDFCVFYMN